MAEKPPESAHRRFTLYLREAPGARSGQNGARRNGGPARGTRPAAPGPTGRDDARARGDGGPKPDAASRRSEQNGGPKPDRGRLPPERRGLEATRPREIPRPGWKDVLARTYQHIQDHRMLMVSGALAFFGLLAIFPGLIALVSIYGLVSDPADVEAQMAVVGEPLPAEAETLLMEQMQSIVASAPSGLGLAVGFGILVALWSASTGVAYLIDTMNIAYDEAETRGFVKRRGLALLFTLGVILFVVLAVFGITALPPLVEALGLGEAGTQAVALGRWPVLGLMVILGLAVLYRFGPDRKAAKWRWVTPGAVVATVLWLAASLLFSLYVSVAGGFAETYGALGSIIVLLLWLQISALAILVGAELDASLEHQTARDSTIGPDEPMGEREAVKADTLAPEMRPEGAPG
jgi:membrane protein